MNLDKINKNIYIDILLYIKINSGIQIYMDAHLIAFLDDATRYVIHAEIFPRKTTLNAAEAHVFVVYSILIKL